MKNPYAPLPPFAPAYSARWLRQEQRPPQQQARGGPEPGGSGDLAGVRINQDAGAAGTPMPTPAGGGAAAAGPPPAGAPAPGGLGGAPQAAFNVGVPAATGRDDDGDRDEVGDGNGDGGE